MSPSFRARVLLARKPHSPLTADVPPRAHARPFDGRLPGGDARLPRRVFHTLIVAVARGSRELGELLQAGKDVTCILRAVPKERRHAAGCGPNILLGPSQLNKTAGSMIHKCI